MSYEGFEQHLCIKGHRFNTDCSYSITDERDLRCPHCKEKSAMCISVDETNCYSVGFIPDSEWEKWRVSKEKVKTCNLGHQHVTHHAIYRLPSERERKAAQFFRQTDRCGKEVWVRMYSDQELPPE